MPLGYLFLFEQQSSKNYTGLRLSTGVDNKDGMRFYEREHWMLRAVVFKKKV
jgi:hypothetical protein